MSNNNRRNSKNSKTSNNKNKNHKDKDNKDNNNINTSFNEEIFQFNQRKLKTISNEEKLKCMKSTPISEAIAKWIIEKLISLTISTSYNMEINKKISDFCFKNLKKTIDTYTELNFLAYDRDDVPNIIEKEIKYSKSFNNDINNNKNNNNNNFININDFNNESEINNKINKTQIISDRKILNEDDNKKENEEKEKKEENENEKKEDESYLNYFQKQESIKNIENIQNENINNKINKKNKKNKNLIFFDASYIGENDWNIVPQPRPVQVDRNASSMIKYNKDNVDKIREVKNDDRTVIMSTSMNTKSLIFPKSPHKRNKSKKSENEPNKKKPRVLIEFPSYDIDPKNFLQLNDTEELKNLRKEHEQEVEQKKIEYQIKLKKEKERAQIEAELFNKNKELINKNITVDHNGNIVNIRQINLEQLINEFTLGKSDSKEIERINGPDFSIKRSSINVEKNTYANNVGAQNVENLGGIMGKLVNLKKNIKNKKKKRKSDVTDEDNGGLNNNSQISLNNVNNLNNNNNKNAGDVKAKTSIGFNYILNAKQRQFAAGSNFDIMQMETGVDLTEDSKFKSGGKDFFKKFQRYSLENFENQQNRTVTANFYKTKELMDQNKNELKIIDEFKPLKTDENFHHNNNIYKNINLEPSEKNNVLHLKTKNLKLVLNELDLISESEEKEIKNLNLNFNNNNKKMKLGDLYNKKNEENNKKNFFDMNKFTKTIVGNSNWGNNMRLYQKNNNNNNDFKIPVKLNSKQIEKEINKNQYNKKLPRSRLPPINNNNNNLNNNNLNRTEKNFYKRGKKNLKLKEDSFINAIEKDEENDTPRNNTIQNNTTNNFFKKVSG
jgi:hypothetical protein